MTPPALETFGPRLCVCGPSNSGKSTLSVALGRKLELPVFHLDLLFHLPNTNWQPRPRPDFERLHREAITGERWVMEGNYFGALSERLDRATGIILTGNEPTRSLFRYIRRTLFEPNRPGALEGGEDRLNWDMIHFIAIEQPRKREHDVELLRRSGLPMLELRTMRELNACYEAWGLEQ